jgi:L-amino acid N-acyltransferase YncA
LKIRNAVPADAKAIADIYNYYILDTTVTFEEKAVSVSEMQKRIQKVTQNYPWLVAEEGEGQDKELVGYAYGGQFSERSAYRFSVEGTVYLKHGYQNRGVGSKLYSELLKILKEKGFKAVFGRIALPNEPSVHLHEKLGFKKVAHLSKVGFKMENWIDVGYWELLLN